MLDFLTLGGGETWLTTENFYEVKYEYLNPRLKKYELEVQEIISCKCSNEKSLKDRVYDTPET